VAPVANHRLRRRLDAAIGTAGDLDLVATLGAGKLISEPIKQVYSDRANTADQPLSANRISTIDKSGLLS